MDVGKAIAFVFGAVITIVISSYLGDEILELVAGEYRSIITILWTVGIGSCLVIALVFLMKDWIFKTLSGAAEHSVENVAAAVVETLTNIRKKDAEAASDSAKRSIAAWYKWYAWINFYKWTGRVLVALFVGFVASLGTLLLIEQNKKLDQQNDLSSLDMLKRVSEALEVERSARRTGDMDLQFTDNVADPTSHMHVDLRVNGCALDDLFGYHFSGVNASVLDWATRYGRKPSMAERVREVAEILVQDDRSSVRASGLILMHNLNMPAPKEEVALTGLRMENLKAPKGSKLYLEGMLVLGEVECEACLIRMYRSRIKKIEGTVEAYNSLVREYERGKPFIAEDGRQLAGLILENSWVNAKSGKNLDVESWQKEWGEFVRGDNFLFSSSFSNHRPQLFSGLANGNFTFVAEIPGEQICADVDDFFLGQLPFEERGSIFGFLRRCQLITFSAGPNERPIGRSPLEVGNEKTCEGI